MLTKLLLIDLSFCFVYFVSATLFDSQSKNIATILNYKCLVLYDVSLKTKNMRLFNNFQILQHIFELSTEVDIYETNLQMFRWPNGEHIRYYSEASFNDRSLYDFALFPKTKKDRTCLMESSIIWYPKAHAVQVEDLETILDFINEHCFTFVKSSGLTSVEGIHRKEILGSLYSVRQISNVTMGDLFSRSCIRIPNKTWSPDSESTSCEYCSSHKPLENLKMVSTFSHMDDEPTYKSIPKCDVVKTEELSWDTFYSEYLSKSKPFIIKNIAQSWDAYNKWTMQHFYSKYSNKAVHVKLTPGGDYEGVESSHLWEDFKSFKIPDVVKKQLLFPDLVVVRPAAVNMNFSEFLDLITSSASQDTRNISGYLEYSSIPDHLSELEDDIFEFNFVKGRLRRRHLNLWLSDGHTLGRLHFDPFDNLLCQLKGAKQVILFEPHHNERFYEAHIPQATLKYNKTLNKFRRFGLEDSTSMVMSPIDLQEPDFGRFPLFKEAQPLNCTIEEGDVLYMPAFWWHEVYSFPNIIEKRNMAVNFWYEPFLQKEFPCADCRLDVNPFYRHLL